MKNLTTGHPLKLIFFFALPLMFGNFLQQLYIMVDTMILLVEQIGSTGLF